MPNTYIYNPVHINNADQALAQMAALSPDQLARLAHTYAKTAASYTTSLWLWRISTITTLAITVIAFIGLTQNRDSNEVPLIVTVVAALLCIGSIMGWINTSQAISNANKWHSHCIDLIHAPILN